MLTRARKGFTLLELIVVLVILGLLAAIAIPTYQAVIGKSEQTSATETAKALARAIQATASLDRVNPQTVVEDVLTDEFTAPAGVTVDAATDGSSVEVSANGKAACVAVPTSYSAPHVVTEAACPAAG